MMKFSRSCDTQIVLRKFGNFLSGYKWWHIALGIQMGAGFVLALVPVLADNLFNALYRGGPLIISISVVLTLEPSTGDCIKKFVLRSLAVCFGTGVGLACLEMSYAAVPDGLQADNTVALASIVVIFFALFGFIIMVHQARYPQHAYAIKLMLFTLPVIVIPNLRTDCNVEPSVRNVFFRMLNIILGVVISAVLSLVLFPVRARPLLQASMARTLIRIGDWTFWLTEQLSETSSKSLEGVRSALDEDDGRQDHFKIMEAVAQKLSAEVLLMEDLLSSADKEWNLCMKPRRFPTHQYSELIRMCRLSVGSCNALMSMVQKHRFPIDLSTVQKRAIEIRGVGVQVSACYTALGALVKPHRSWLPGTIACLEKKKKKVKQPAEIEKVERNVVDIEQELGSVDDPFAASVSSCGDEPSLVPFTSEDIRNARAAARQQSIALKRAPFEENENPCMHAQKKVRSTLETLCILDTIITEEALHWGGHATVNFVSICTALSVIAHRGFECYLLLDPDTADEMMSFYGTLPIMNHKE